LYVEKWQAQWPELTIEDMDRLPVVSHYDDQHRTLLQNGVVALAATGPRSALRGATVAAVGATVVFGLAECSGTWFGSRCRSA